MRLPTDQEIAEAGREIDWDGPLPLGVIVDRNPDLSSVLQGMYKHVHREDASGEYRETIVKAALLLGLNLGIRIGEMRARHSDKLSYNCRHVYATQLLCAAPVIATIEAEAPTLTPQPFPKLAVPPLQPPISHDHCIGMGDYFPAQFKTPQNPVWPGDDRIVLPTLFSPYEVQAGIGPTRGGSTTQQSLHRRCITLD